MKLHNIKIALFLKPYTNTIFFLIQGIKTLKKKIRFDTIANNRLWLSSGENLNDPYEFKSMFLDEQTIKDLGWDIRKIRELMDSLRKSFGILFQQ